LLAVINISVTLALPDVMPYGTQLVMSTSAAAPNTAVNLSRGVCRALGQLGYVSLVEFPLANGRCADVLALGKNGELLIVEVKSSVADFRGDRKWSAYRDFSDRLYFAVQHDFPRVLIPDECGLMVADPFGAALLRDGNERRLDAARRRALTTRFARIAAARLSRLLDPDAARLEGL